MKVKCQVIFLSDFPVFLEDGNSTIISTPNFPFNYPQNYNGEWKFVATDGFLLNFTAFFLEHRFDFLYIWNGPHSNVTNQTALTGMIDVSKVYVFEQPFLHLHFTSDETIQEYGFRLEITAANTSSLDTLTVGESITISFTAIPSFFHNDGSYIYEEWRFFSKTGFQVNVTALNTSNSYTYLDIWNGMSQDQPDFVNRFKGLVDNGINYAFDKPFLRIYFRLSLEGISEDIGPWVLPYIDYYVHHGVWGYNFNVDILVKNVTSIIGESK
ncbi:CUB and sushi domain-containing protein 3 [Holothuria leucospilota]|uniref:CUB and sushi domain-containing protein 3 n=1 Tax=Holothuria leucospilota TaxID=206669 RepID=A0A9Q1BHS3_HOLLE|nr:CUB and sushi domain-containing protein 3 [Holothuria leucospilota]